MTPLCKRTARQGYSFSARGLLVRSAPTATSLSSLTTIAEAKISNMLRLMQIEDEITQGIGIPVTIGTHFTR